jgi:hypothetical protein
MTGRFIVDCAHRLAELRALILTATAHRCWKEKAPSAAVELACLRATITAADEQLQVWLWEDDAEDEATVEAFLTRLEETIRRRLARMRGEEQPPPPPPREFVGIPFSFGTVEARIISVADGLVHFEIPAPAGSAIVCYFEDWPRARHRHALGGEPW